MRSETKAPWNNGTRLEMRWAGPEESTAHVFGSKSEETWTMDPVDVAYGVRSPIGEGLKNVPAGCSGLQFCSDVDADAIEFPLLA